MTLLHMRLALATLIAGTCVSLAAVQDEVKPSTPAEQFQALQKEFGQAAYSYFQSTNDADRKQITDRVDKVASKCLEIVDKNPDEPFSLDAMVAVVTQDYWLDNYTRHPGLGKESRQAKAIALILDHHLQSDKLAEACKRVAFGFRQECETFLRTVLEKNPHHEVQGNACLRLAQYLVNRLDRLDSIKGQPELASRYELLFGRDYIERLRRQDRAEVMKEAEGFYERAAEQYSDVKMTYGEIVGEQAKTELYELRYLAVGKQAQEMEGEDQDAKSFKLSDYRGKVVLLYFWSEF